jgi:hypothetical protein
VTEKPGCAELPNESEGGNIFAMARDNRNQTPDLFSTGRLDGSPSNNPPEALRGRPSRRTALPKDLPKAIRYLEDQELDWLLRTAIHEAKRRGRPMPMTEARPTNTPPASSEPIPKQAKPPGRPTRQRQVGVAAAALTKGQVNAVRAAFTNHRFARLSRPTNPSDDGLLAKLAGTAEVPVPR